MLNPRLICITNSLFYIVCQISEGVKKCDFGPNQLRMFKKVTKNQHWSTKGQMQPHDGIILHGWYARDWHQKGQDKEGNDQRQ